MRLLRYFWALPTTLLGLFFLPPALLKYGGAQVVDGVLEIHGGAAAFFLRKIVPLPGGASAMTLGHVVLGLNPAVLEHTRSHERVHVRQCERWGPLFVPAYFLASFVAWRRGLGAYEGNAFEREAYERAR